MISFLSWGWATFESILSCLLCGIQLNSYAVASLCYLMDFIRLIIATHLLYLSGGNWIGGISVSSCACFDIF